jgi:hypothetical protein
MEKKTKIILISCGAAIAGAIGWSIYVNIRNKKIYSDLMNTLALGTGATGTTSDIKISDPNSGFNPSTWSYIVKAGTMQLSDFKLLPTQQTAQAIADASDSDAVNIILQQPNKAQLSYLSYWYLKKAMNDKQTLLQRVQDMDTDLSTKVMQYVSGLPNM